MRIDVIFNGYIRVDSIDSCRKELSAELCASGAEVAEVTADEYLRYIEVNGLPTAAVMWDKSVKLGYELEARGIRLFNTARTIEICDDKGLTHSALLPHVDTPRTIVPPESYGAPLSAEFLQYVADTLGFPMVVKQAKGSFGEGVHLVWNAEELRACALAIREPIFQKFVGDGRGRDLRVYIVGGEPIATMLRENAGDFRSNIEIGGRGRDHELNYLERKNALLAARAVGADFCGVDILDAEGFPVIEVNSNAVWVELRRVSGVNIPHVIAEYIMQETANAK